jgi:hypothetical protein
VTILTTQSVRTEFAHPYVVLRLGSSGQTRMWLSSVVRVLRLANLLPKPAYEPHRTEKASCLHTLTRVRVLRVPVHHVRPLGTPPGAEALTVLVIVTRMTASVPASFVRRKSFRFPLSIRLITRLRSPLSAFPFRCSTLS